MKQRLAENGPQEGQPTQDPAGGDNHKYVNRAEFNKSHDYKRKPDRNRLDVGRMSQGHQEDYGGMANPAGKQIGGPQG